MFHPQLGVDRIVDFTFGHGENEHHLILELYSQVAPHVNCYIVQIRKRRLVAWVQQACGSC
jgi:predicted ribosome quality control (RQC) complex YloA/Tae2 family protein